jgi:hypothetical protein
MSTAADDSAVEAAFEAVLAGRPVPEQGTALAAFTEAVRSSASSTGRPNAALAALLADGLPGDRAAVAASSARRRPRGIRPARLFSARPVVQLAAGAGLVLVAFTGAGAAGALPDSLQHGFATVAATVGVEVEDPQPAQQELPPVPSSTPTPDATEPTDGAGDDAQAPTVDDGYTLEDWAEGPAVGQSFGDWVSEGARHGYADGAVISREARERGIETEDGTPSPAPETDDPAAPPARGPAATPGGAGHGNSNPGPSRGPAGGATSHPTGNAGGNGSGNGSGHGHP